MRKEVVDLAQNLAEDLLSGLDYLSILEASEGAEEVLTEEEFDWVYEAVTGAAVRITEE